VWEIRFLYPAPVPPRRASCTVGLRYLENGRISPGQGSLCGERNRLVKRTLTLCSALPTTIPFQLDRWSVFGLGEVHGPQAKASVTGALAVQNRIVFVRPPRRKSCGFTRSSLPVTSSCTGRPPSTPPDVICTATYYDAWLSLSRTALCGTHSRMREPMLRRARFEYMYALKARGRQGCP